MSKEYRIPEDAKDTGLVRGIINASYWHWHNIDKIQHTKAIKCLNNLEALNNANPSEAMKRLEEIRERFSDDSKGNNSWGFKISQELNTIKNALIKAQEMEKVLEILKPLCEVVETPVRKDRYLKINGVVVYTFKNEEEYELLKRWQNE